MNEFALIKIELIFPNPEQPRKEFDKAEMDGLVESIRSNGVLVPVQLETAGDAYILHDGERRLRAAKLAGLTEIPAEIQPGLNGSGPKVRLLQAVIINVQRADMNPVEEGQSYRRMRDDFGMSVRDISKQTGVYEKRITDRLKITQLEPEIQAFIARGMFPSSETPINALLMLPAGAERVSLAKALAHHKARIGTIQAAVEKYLAGKEAKQIIPENAAVVLASKQARPKAGRPKWNALAQAGKLPAWSLVAEHSKATCQACALSDMASQQTCSECPHVDLLRRLMEIADVG